MNVALYDQNFLGTSTTQGIALGTESRIVDDINQQIIDHFRKSVSVESIISTFNKEEIATYLNEIYEECSSENWDGYDSNPISEEAFEQAQSFLYTVMNENQLNVPIPDISADPDGDISLEWRKEHRFTFVVSINGQGLISYAGLFGKNKIHGTEYFGQEIPPSIIFNLRRLYS